MAGQIPQMGLSEFRKLTSDKIRQLKSMEIVCDGEYVFTAIIPQTQFIKESAEEIGIVSNAVGGKDPKKTQ